MRKKIITPEVKYFLLNKEFINVGTCDFTHRPNVAPKFILGVDEDNVYLADYIMGRTWKNIKINPRVSLSTTDMNSLIGFQLNGEAAIIIKGARYKASLEEFKQRQIHFSVKRVAEGVQKQRKHANFEITFPEKIAVLQIKILEIVEITPTGQLKRKKSS